MNSKPFPFARRALLMSTAIASVAVLLAGSGCSHRPVVIQTPSTIIIQTPAPAPAVAPAPVPIPAVVVMKDAPPPPRFEQTPPRPSSESVWISGYWFWREGQLEWISGHWDVPPRVGATWIPPRWEKQGDSYVFTQGYWQ